MAQICLPTGRGRRKCVHWHLCCSGQEWPTGRKALEPWVACASAPKEFPRLLPPPRGCLRNGAVRPGLLEAGGEERV